MKEDIFFKVGYTTYLQKNEKKKWTSKITDMNTKHKFISVILVVIIISVMMNFWLIYRFINILETSKIF